MEAIDEEKFLSLRLGIVSDSCNKERPPLKMKRKRMDVLKPCEDSDHEGKVFRLLQVREQMLRQDNKLKKKLIIDEDDNGFNGLKLIHSLLVTATSIDENTSDAAIENLTELYRKVSLTGDSVQRVVAYFADGLAARVLTRDSPFYEMLMKKPTIEEQFLAFTYLYRASPFYQFAHFTANQAIIEAFEKEEDRNNLALHVIDFDISYGFQWPSLIQSLSEKATSSNRISLRITGYGRSLEELQETEAQLVTFAKSCHNLVFEFQGLLRGSKITNLRKKKSETVAVNLVLHLNSLNHISKVSETLNFVNSLNPSIVVLAEQEGSHNPRSFLARFMESLHYFAAMFDSLDDCFPLDSPERLSIEKNHLGEEIKSMINYDIRSGCGDGNFGRYERLDVWKERMKGHGFEGIKLSSKSMMQAKLLLKIRSNSPCSLQLEGDSNNGFKVAERDDKSAVSLWWQDRCLLTVTSWRCA